ncbi:MAG: hypothetical protein H0W02_21705 [Ktedonobacteraceae bacterium]|nr:hypothetical protein [Ktedonobacteraceae bacterium]
MKASATLLFWIGCIAIIIFAIIQLVFPNLLAPLFISVTVVFCIRQWYRKIREMKDLLAEERQARRMAELYIYAQDQYMHAQDQYMHARIPPGSQRGKKKR